MKGIKIFLTNLGKYNEGELVGEWVDLPVDDDFEQALEDIEIDDEYEEWFITDYEAPFRIDEYEDIYELNKKAEEFDNLIDSEKEAVSEISENYTDDFQEALDIVESGDYRIWYGVYDDWSLGEQIIDELGMPQNPEYYFDYESFGRDLRLGEDYVDDLGSLEVLGKETLERYFDYAKFGHIVQMEGTFIETDDGFLEIW